MFKSCFPNSMLEGQPGDPPAAGDGLTVSNAKYIYNDLLNYFRTRPDKLFVVITAPPVQDSSYADNARAFNLWLMQDWLNEASYPYNNVVVFDFYNVLTHPDNHHRYANGQIEYEPSHGNNTSRYASAGDDDHPNAAGSRKATEEFIPLLNLFYHRWKAGSANIPPGAGIEPVQNTPVVEAPGPGGPALPNPITGAGELIDDFEAGSPADSDGWQAWWDEATQTRAACAAEGGQANSGTQALHITYAIDAGSWMTCALIYASAHPWDAARGLSLYVHALQPGLAFDVNTYRGPDENRETYVYPMETTQEMVDGWAAVTIPWGEFLRADWEANAGTPFNPAGASGMAFGFGSDIPISGEIWIDDVTLFAEPALIAPAPTAALGSPATQQPAAATEEVQESQPETEPETETEEEDGGGGLPCPSALVMGLVVAGLFWQRRR